MCFVATRIQSNGLYLEKSTLLCCMLVVGGQCVPGKRNVFDWPKCSKYCFTMANASLNEISNIQESRCSDVACR